MFQISTIRHVLATLAPGYSAASGSERSTSRAGSPYLASPTCHAASAQPSPSPVDNPSKKQEDYPNVKFWHKAKWSTHKNTTKAFAPKDGTKPARGRGQAAQGKNIMSGFIEDENGNAVDGHHVTAIRAHAQAIWVSLGKLNLLSATWGKADSKVQ